MCSKLRMGKGQHTLLQCTAVIHSIHKFYILCSQVTLTSLREFSIFNAITLWKFSVQTCIVHGGIPALKLYRLKISIIWQTTFKIKQQSMKSTHIQQSMSQLFTMNTNLYIQQVTNLVTCMSDRLIINSEIVSSLILSATIKRKNIFKRIQSP